MKTYPYWLYSNWMGFSLKKSNFIREMNCLPNEIYENVEYIGEGAYGTILKVKPCYINEMRAMKIIKKCER